MSKTTNTSGANKGKGASKVKVADIVIDETEVNTPAPKTEGGLTFKNRKPEKGAKTINATKCPITRETFADEALPVSITVAYGDHVETLVFYPREFSTGSLGWFLNGKVKLPIGPEGGEQEVKCQLNGQLVLVGSKEAK